MPSPSQLIIDNLDRNKFDVRAEMKRLHEGLDPAPVGSKERDALHPEARIKALEHRVEILEARLNTHVTNMNRVMGKVLGHFERLKTATSAMLEYVDTRLKP